MLDDGRGVASIKMVAEEMGVAYSTLFYWIPGNWENRRRIKAARHVPPAPRQEATVTRVASDGKDAAIKSLRDEVEFLRGVIKSLTKEGAK